MSMWTKCIECGKIVPVDEIKDNNVSTYHYSHCGWTQQAAAFELFENYQQAKDNFDCLINEKPFDIDAFLSSD